MAGHSKLSPTQRAEYEQAFVEFWEQHHTQVRRWVQRNISRRHSDYLKLDPEATAGYSIRIYRIPPAGVQ